MDARIIATDLLKESTQRHNIHLALLVADTGLWVSPDYYQWLLDDRGTGALRPDVRRARPGRGEARREIIDGILFDDNSYANSAFKKALGFKLKNLIGFAVCHIWPDTCYDERYHTHVANLVLLPRELASLTDHNLEIEQVLKYRAYELYGWWPEEEQKPMKPASYPSEWREPQPYP